MQDVPEGSGDLSPEGQQRLGWGGMASQKADLEAQKDPLHSEQLPCPPSPPEQSLVASGLRRVLRRMRCFQRRDLCKVPALNARSAQQLSSLRAPRQSEETRREGQMQSCLEASPFQLPDGLPPAYLGLCLPRSSRKPWVLPPASAQLWPGHQMATCSTSPCDALFLAPTCPLPRMGLCCKGRDAFFEWQFIF